MCLLLVNVRRAKLPGRPLLLLNLSIQKKSLTGRNDDKHGTSRFDIDFEVIGNVGGWKCAGHCGGEGLRPVESCIVRVVILMSNRTRCSTPRSSLSQFVGWVVCVDNLFGTRLYNPLQYGSVFPRLFKLLVCSYFIMYIRFLFFSFSSQSLRGFFSV